MQGNETDRKLYHELFNPERGQHGYKQRNTQRRKIKSCFRNIKVVGLPFLLLNPFPDVLTYSHFTPPNARFQRGLAKIAKYVLSSSKVPKFIDSLEITGNSVTSVLTNTVKISNAGNVFISNVALRASIQIWVTGILYDFNENVSTALHDIDTFVDKCNHSLISFKELMQNKANSIPRSLVRFWMSVQKEAYSEIEEIYKQYFITYMKAMRRRFKFPGIDDCKTMHFNSIRCHYETAADSL